LPPSPGEERKSFWGHTNSSRSTTSSTTHRTLIKENEPFNISRESFDSYRRSFVCSIAHPCNKHMVIQTLTSFPQDISGRSPVISGDRPRASLDSRTFQSFQSSPRKSTNLQRPAPVPLTSPMREEEDFEDVGLNDDPKPVQQAAAPKKRGFLSRLTESSNDQAAPGATSGQESKWHFGGRKRGQSGQGAELGSMPQPSRENTPKPVAPESGLRHSETTKQNDTPDKADGNAQTPTPTEP
jgi:hypothetical protein